MPYNNNAQIGVIQNPVGVSLYSTPSTEYKQVTPPSNLYYVVTNTGDFVITNTGDYVVAFV